MATGQDIYNKVKAEMAGGLNTSQACEKVGKELDRSRQSIATTYYRWLKKDPDAPPPSRRGRPRKSGTASPAKPSAPRATGSDPLAQLSREMDQLRAENAHLRAIVDAVRQTVK